jgi:hypothetical protein
MIIEVHVIPLDPVTREERRQALRTLLLQAARRMCEGVATYPADHASMTMSPIVTDAEKAHG